MTMKTKVIVAAAILHCRRRRSHRLRIASDGNLMGILIFVRSHRSRKLLRRWNYYRRRWTYRNPSSNRGPATKDVVRPSSVE